MRVFITILLVLFSSNCFAIQKAITDTGKEVLLKDNGTWEYINNLEAPPEILTNKTPFHKSPNSKFLLKSTKTNSAYWINTAKWTFNKPVHNTAAEYEFQLKSKDLWAMSISENLPIPIKNLSDIAYENSKAAAPNSKILKREYRIVNGNKVVYMEMKGTIQGIDFMYFGYYFSNKTGSTQFLTYTAADLVYKYKTEIDEFLNGFVVQ